MSHSAASAIAFSLGIVSSRMGARTSRSGASTASETSKRVWWFALRVHPWATVDAPAALDDLGELLVLPDVDGDRVHLEAALDEPPDRHRRVQTPAVREDRLVNH